MAYTCTAIVQHHMVVMKSQHFNQFLANVNYFRHMLSPVRLSSVTLVHPTQAVKFLAIFLRRLVPWPSADIHQTFYGD